MNYLIIDDEALIRTSVRYALQHAEIEVTEIQEASDGVEALRILTTFPADFILTDICMPEMDGLVLIEQVRSRFPNVKIVVLSGFSDFQYVRHALRHGALDYLLKPVKAGEVNEVLKRAAKPKVLPPVEMEYKILEYIREHYCEEISLEVIAAQFNFSPKYLSQLIKSRLGESFTDIVINLRMEKAKELLLKSNLSIKEIANFVGYPDQQYFHRLFKRKTNLRPSAYRENKGKSLA